MVEPFTLAGAHAKRFTIICFTYSSWEKASSADRAEARALGFPLPPEAATDAMWQGVFARAWPSSEARVERFTKQYLAASVQAHARHGGVELDEVQHVDVTFAEPEEEEKDSDNEPDEEDEEEDWNIRGAAADDDDDDFICPN